MSIRESFVAHFGEDDAIALEAASASHSVEWLDVAEQRNPGSDPFRYVIVMCIGWECVTRFREAHGVKASEQDLHDWIVEHADLGNHDGDVDYLALLAGAYTPYVKAQV